MTTGSPDTGDQELIREFLTESLESLADVDGLFVQLEQRPDDLSTVDRIFRPVHSIKGNSSFFGLVNIKNFAHTMENLLQEIRSRKRMVTPEIIDLLLGGVDLLRGMIERFAAGSTSKEFLPEESACLERFASLQASTGGDIATLAAAARQLMENLLAGAAGNPLEALIKDAHNKVLEILHNVAPKAAAASAPTTDAYRIGKADVTADLNAVKSFIHDIKKAAEDKARSEAFLVSLGKLRAAAEGEKRVPLIEVLAALHNDFTTIQNAGIGFDDLMGGLLKERLDKAMESVEVVPAAGTAPASAPATAPVPALADAPAAAAVSAPAEKPAAAAHAQEAASKTLRIEEEKVDHFMSFVGELIIASEVFAYLQKKLEPFPQVREISQEFKNANITFNELSNNLQKSLMAVRRLPLKNILQKMPRLVRDVCSSTGKQAKLILEGEDVQIDKSLLEGLENPLVHMVRNSVDHGLESPEERAKAGKEEVGSVWITASADDETFRLTIRDDGAGLNLAAIKSKAVEKGLITEEKARSMSDSEAGLLIFGAGVSTAKKVTDVSGRGVGMDVVRTNIEGLGGSIAIDTVRGKGTTFTISLPMTVTLMVVDGLVAKVGEAFYIIPVMDVRESVRPQQNQVSTIAGKGEVIDVRGQLYRLVRLNEVLDLQARFTRPEESTVILVESRRMGTCGVMVDEVVGQQSLVLKDLGRQFNSLQFLQGGAVMGDGRIALVLDTEGLLTASLTAQGEMV